MLTVGLTTGADSWADALKVNCEKLWKGSKKAPWQPSSSPEYGNDVKESGKKEH